jgi:hypothetical protein
MQNAVGMSMPTCLERTNAAAAGTMIAASSFMRITERKSLAALRSSVCSRIDTRPIEAPAGVALLDFLGEKTWR